MRYLRFGPLRRDLSRLVLGTAGYERVSSTSTSTVDAYRELGGNVVDTGRESGNAEGIVGRWLRERRLRDEIVVLTKGAHDDNDTGRRRVNPAEIAQDLEASLRTLGRESIDIYCLHRDDPDVPIGPIVEALARTDGWGASARWALPTGPRPGSTKRGAARRATDRALRLLEPRIEPGCAREAPSARRGHDPRPRGARLVRSAPAAGVRVGVARGRLLRRRPDPRRRARVRDRRQSRAPPPDAGPGHAPRRPASQVALAWVLHQPFPTYALVGPRSVAELRESVAALELALTPAESRWLDLEPGAEEP